jgi:hypothetical protein
LARSLETLHKIEDFFIDQILDTELTA